MDGVTLEISRDTYTVLLIGAALATLFAAIVAAVSMDNRASLASVTWVAIAISFATGAGTMRDADTVEALEESYSVQLTSEDGSDKLTIPDDGEATAIQYRTPDGKLLPGFLYVSDDIAYLQNSDKDTLKN